MNLGITCWKNARATMGRGDTVTLAALMLGLAVAPLGASDRGMTGRSGEPLFTPIVGVREFSGQMIVRPAQVADGVREGLSEDQARERHAAAHGAMNDFTQARYIPQTDEYIITLPEGLSEEEVARRLLATGNFQYVEPNWIVYPLACPNDSRFSSQWHHNANRMNSCAGWDLHTGDPSVSVGICDTGLRTTHEDFQLHRLEGYNAVDERWESQGGQINDLHGHGTATTGCAAANGNNGKGIAGVGWNLSHRMLRVSNSSGGGSTLAILQHAARTAVEAGDKVASISYSGVDNSSNLTTATYVKSLGGLMVWAAGNEGRNLTLSNRDDDDLLVIGATDSGDNRASFSNFGPMVDFTAPGVDVFTCNAGSDTSYGGASGTSFACPLAAGLAALVWSRNPSLDPDSVEEAVKLSCDDLGQQGIDNNYGYGRIDVREALIRGGSGEPVLGACCFNDGSCSDQYAQDCRNAGGSWKFNTSCSTYQCPQPGACCVDDARCEIVLQRDCNGSFAGERTTCQRQCPCDKVKKFRATCSSGGTLKVIAKFFDTSFDGRAIGITVSGVEYRVGVFSGKGILFAGPFSGSRTATLTTPNCAISATAQCP